MAQSDPTNTNTSRRPWYRKKRWWLLAVVVLLVVIGAASSSTPKAHSATAVSTVSSNTQYPPQADVSVTSCSADSYGLVKASGTITNHSPKMSDYLIQVNFMRGTLRVGGGGDAEDNIAAHQTSTWQASGPVTGSGPVTCKLVSVDRYAAGG